MTNYEQITATPEALGAFLEALPIASGPWDVEFHRTFCKDCTAGNCDGANCPHTIQRNNPLWWLIQDTEQQHKTELFRAMVEAGPEMIVNPNFGDVYSGLLAAIEKTKKDSAGELPLVRSENGERHTAADNLEFLRGVLEGRVPVPEGTVFNVNTSTGDGAAVQLKPEEDRETEPPAGPHLRFKNGRVRVEDGTEAGEQGSRNIAILKNLCGYCRALAKNSGAVPPEREWATDAAALEFAISILSELREIKEVRIPAEPNTPGAWELMRDILTGKRPAPEGTVFDVVIDMAGNPQAIRSREEPEPAPRALAIAMPGGETVKLNSAAEAYRLAGCIEDMTARVWPEAVPGK